MQGVHELLLLHEELQPATKLTPLSVEGQAAGLGPFWGHKVTGLGPLGQSWAPIPKA